MRGWDFLRSVLSRGDNQETVFAETLRGHTSRPIRVARSDSLQHTQFDLKEMIASAEGQVTVDANRSPEGSDGFDETEVPPTKAVRFFDKEDGYYKPTKYPTRIAWSDDHDLKFEITQHGSLRFAGGTYKVADYSGTLTSDVPAPEVEDVLSPFGFDRNVRGWEFDYTEKGPEDYIEADREYTVTVQDLQKAVRKGKVIDAEYSQAEEGDSETEAVKAVMGGELQEPIMVEEISADNLSMYDITAPDGEYGRLNLSLEGHEPLF